MFKLFEFFCNETFCIGERLSSGKACRNLCPLRSTHFDVVARGSCIADFERFDARLLSEMADLTYHCLVLLALRGLSPEDVEIELEKRLPAANKPG